MIQIEWGIGNRCELENRNQIHDLLIQLADTAARSSPFLVHLTHPLSGTLSIGVGLDMSILSYEKSPGTPPFLVSVGLSESDGYVEFYSGDEPTEFPRWQLISSKIAQSAILDFCELGRLPDYVQWEEV